MSKHEYFVLSYETSPTFLQMRSTDRSAIELLISETKQLVPKCDVMDLTFNAEVRIDHLSNQDKKIYIQLLQILCHNGWEPYAGDYSRTYLRLNYD